MMSLFSDLMVRPGVERLGWTLLHFVWQATAAVFITSIVLRFLRRTSANVRYITLCAALLVTAAAPVATFVGLSGDVRVAADHEFDAWETGVSATETTMDMERPLHEPHLNANSPGEPGSQPLTAQTIPSNGKDTRVSSTSTLAGREGQPSDDRDRAVLVSLRIRARIVAALPWIVAAWIVGVALLAIWHAVGWWTLSRSRRIRIEREYCADDAATSIFQDKESYANALVTLAESAVPVPSSVTASTGGVLTRRIRRLLGLALDQERLIRRPVGAAALAWVGLIVICCFLASPQTIAQPGEERRMVVTPIDEVAKTLPTKLSAEPSEPSPFGNPRGWKLREADSRPSVTADGFQGYRIILRRTWQESIGPPQQQRASPGLSQLIPPEHLRSGNGNDQAADGVADEDCPPSGRLRTLHRTFSQGSQRVLLAHPA